MIIIYIQNDTNNKKFIDEDQIIKNLKDFIKFVDDYQKFYYKDKACIALFHKIIKKKQNLNAEQMLEYIDHILKNDNDECDIQMRNIKLIIILT